MTLRLIPELGAIPDLLDQEVWDVPRRLSREDCLNQTGGPVRRETDLYDVNLEDEP